MSFTAMSTATLLRGATACALLAGATAAHAEAITGAGSTFAAPIYGAWADAAKTATGITLNYQGNGSGAGQKMVTQRTVDFGGSDAPMAADKLAAAKLLQFPSVMGAVDIAVNVPGVADGRLRLDGTVLANIYLGTISAWNDPAIVKLNPGVKLPAWRSRRSIARTVRARPMYSPAISPR